jgi:NADPH:quinone reductase-like Zn-dependent oxidoreductase
MRTVVGATFTLKDTAQAHRLMEERRSIGKVVITIP